MRLLPEKHYQDWRAHKCNEDQVETVDMLNKKYTDTISGDNLNVESEKDNTVVSNENMTKEIVDTVADSAVSNDNVSQNVSSVAQDTTSNLDEALHEQGGLNTKDLKQEFQNTNNDSPPASTSLAPPSSPATQSPNVYNCTPQRSEASPNSPSTSVIQSQQKSKPQKKFTPYKCSFCPKGYASRWGLNRHLKVKHSKCPTVQPANLNSKPTQISSDAYPVLIETNPPLSDDGENLDASNIPLPDEDVEIPGFDFQQFPSRTIAQKRKKKKDLNSNLKKKRTDGNDDDILETRPKRKGAFSGTYGSGSRFYYSWD